MKRHHSFTGSGIPEMRCRSGHAEISRTKAVQCFGGQRQVFGGELLHALCLVLLATDHVVCGHLGAFVAQHTDEDPFRRHWL
jgi:hypothetical protein